MALSWVRLVALSVALPLSAPLHAENLPSFSLPGMSYSIGAAGQLDSRLPAAQSGTGMAAIQGASRRPLENPEQMNPATEVESRPVLRTKPAPSDFQLFVTQASGRQVPRYGQELFSDVPSTFAPVQNIPVSSDYAIGPGDTLLIRAWGGIDFEMTATVDRNGQIYLPKVGAINVSGIRAGEVESYLHGRIGRVFRNFELNVTMGQLRSIQVYVVGHALRPGTYTLSSLSTLVNALFASGGPTTSGSMRHIQLKRAGQLVAEMDLYDFIAKGNRQSDVRLLPGDVIVIPAVGPQVAVLGTQRLQAIYELKQTKETLNAVIEQGGGMPVMTARQMAVLERVDPQMAPARTSLKLVLDAAGLQTPLQDGDVLTLQTVSPEIADAVTLRGNVAEPQRYTFVPGMHVRDLIPNREALLPRAYFNRRNQLVQYSRTAKGAAWETASEGVGMEGRHFDQYPRTAEGTSESASEGVGMGGRVAVEQSENEVRGILDEVNWAYASIERLDKEHLSVGLIPFNLGKAVLEGDSQNNLALQAGDVVTIYSTKDLQVPQSRQKRIVRVDGEVSAPGFYEVKPGETLRQLLNGVGGLTPQAYPYAAEFYRKSTQAEQQKSLSTTLDRMENEVLSAGSQGAVNSLSAEDVAGAKVQQEYSRQMISRLRAVKASGRVVLDIPPDRVGDVAFPDLVLEDGDRLYVPSMSAVVNVVGQVNNQNSFMYRQGLSVADYLAQAGGPNRDGDGSAIYVLKVNGAVSAQEHGGWFGGWHSGESVLPGDTVVVPTKLDRTTFVKSAKDWTQIFYQFGLGAAGIKALGL